MKRYSILIISFIVSVVIFITLIVIQKNIINQNTLVQAYVLNQDVNMHDNITLDMVETTYFSSNTMSDKFYNNIEDIDTIVAKGNLKSGKILFNEDVIKKEEIEANVSKSETEKVVIPVSNLDNAINYILNDNVYINVYVSVNEDYKTYDIAKYESVSLHKEDKNTITFLYLSKVKPVCFLNDNGQAVNKNDLIKSVVLEVTKQQAIYINYIKGKAGFNITVI